MTPSLTDLARRAGSSVRAVHAEVERLVPAGLLAERRLGNPRLVRAATDTVLAGPLTDLLTVTFGPMPVLDDLLRGVAGIDEAHIFGSWAARYAGEPGPVPHDVDVLVVGSADLDRLDLISQEAEKRLGRPVSITRLRTSTWQKRDTAEAATDPFLVSLRQRPMVTLDRHIGRSA